MAIVVIARLARQPAPRTDCRQSGNKDPVKLSKASADPSLCSRMTLLWVGDDGAGRALGLDFQRYFPHVVLLMAPAAWRSLSHHLQIL